MKPIFLLLLISIFPIYSVANNIAIDTIFTTSDIYNDTVTYNIASFHYQTTNESSSNITLAPESNSLKIGIVSTNNILVDLIWEIDNESHAFSNENSMIQAIEVMDLNNDQFKDIIIHFTDPQSEFPDQVISTFLINNQNKFQEIPETFVKNKYTLLDNHHIKYITPISLFGRPYIDEDSQKETRFWVDYYAFQGMKLININHQYRSFFETLKKEASEDLSQTLHLIKTYTMTADPTLNQLQLEEFYNDLTELKTIIFRSNQVIY